MKNNKLFLLLSFIMPFFVACSDTNAEQEDITGGDEPVKYSFAIPDFADSYVYVVSDGDKKVAEICNEYIPGFSTETRATVAYPYDKDGNADHAKGFMLDNGGSVAWSPDGCTYKAGTSGGAKGTIYLDGTTFSQTAVEGAKELKAVADKVKDADNNIYKVVKIGLQYWMGENFKCTKYNDGSTIRNDVKLEDWETQTEGLYTAYTAEKLEATVKDPETAKANYGFLYNWFAASTKLAPTGWKLPSNDDWSQLRTCVGDNVMTDLEDAMAGAYLSEVGYNRWVKPSCTTPTFVATDVTGFTAVGGGCVFFLQNGCTGLRDYGYWWASDEDPLSEEWGEPYAYFWRLNTINAMLSGGKVFDWVDEETNQPHFSDNVNACTNGYSVRFIRK